MARGSQTPFVMSHRLLQRFALLLSFMLVSTLVVNAQRAPAQPGRPTQLQAGERDESDLVESIKHGDLANVVKLLLAGASADDADDGGDLALCWAVRVDRRDIVEVLLAHGADINNAEHDGGTALDIAATAGHAAMVQLLLAHRPEVNHKDEGGHTALILATFGAMIKDAPPSVIKGLFREADQERQQFLSHIGTEHGAVVALLLQAGADVNAQAEDCHLTALMVAAMFGNVEIVKTLLAYRANVNLKSGDWDAIKFAESPEGTFDLESEDEETKQGLSTWSQLTEPGRREVARLLRSGGAKD